VNFYLRIYYLVILYTHNSLVSR